jgi:inner membrane protein
VIFWHTGLTTVIVWFVMRGNPRVDYRIVMVASLLPDIIDKPLGRIFFKERLGSGRIYAHTLLLNVALFCLVFFMRGRIKRQFVLVPISTLLHLAEDGMWSSPRVFWWPLFGSHFPRPHVPHGWLAYLRPGAIAEEVVGILLLLWLFGSHGVLNREGLKNFIKTGRLETE